QAGFEARLRARGQTQATHPHALGRPVAPRLATAAEPTGQRLRQVRQSTVEPVFGHLIRHFGLRQVIVRGHAGAHKTMLLTAVADNLKKLLRHRPNRQLSLAMALPRPLLAANTRAWRRNRRTEAPTRAIAKRLLRNRTF
ncbi:transposase, partial [Hymenobacter sp. B1770]|uniref:transposase n=1 Tax=Hymenobacter sp. B1770 TaxID=1718788 RepID=UPI003CFA0BE4